MKDVCERVLLRKQRDLYGAIDSVLSSIEAEALGVSQDGFDVSGVAYRGDTQVAIAVLRAASEGGTFQVCLVMGRRKWRGYTGGVSASTIAIPVTGVMKSDGKHGSYKMKCNCCEYDRNNTCEHIQCILSSQYIQQSTMIQPING